MQAGGLGLTTASLSLLTAELRLESTAAYLLTLPIVTLSTFGANRRWTFADARVDLSSGTVA